MRIRRSARGFTLVELMVTIAVALALLGVAGWAGQHALIGYRVNGAANEFVFFARKAASIAARTNSRVRLVVDAAGPAACNPSYRIETVNVAGTVTAEYDRVCLNADFPGVILGNGGATGAVTCPDETSAGLASLANCSACTGTTVISVFPSGQVVTEEAAGETLIFSPRSEPDTSRVLAVGIRNTSGKTRAYRPDGAGWVCP